MQRTIFHENSLMNLHSYISGGSSKFGSLSIADVDGQSTLQYTLFIDGKETWSTSIASPPAIKSSSAAGSFFDRLGFP